MIERYVISACRKAPLAHDDYFPVHTAAFDATSRLDALWQAKQFFDEMALQRGKKDWTHIRIVDGPDGFE